MLEKIEKIFKKTKPIVDSFAASVEKDLQNESSYGKLDFAFRREMIRVIEECKHLKEAWKSWRPPWNTQEWETIYKDINSCNKCTLDNIRKEKNRFKVPGSFNDREKSIPILVLSEAPGYYEETTNWVMYGMTFGYPFLGKSGNLFDKMVEVVGINRFAMFITNVLKCSDKNEESKNILDVRECYGVCNNFLERQINVFKPVIIWCLGTTGQEFAKRFIYSEGLKYRDISFAQGKECTITDRFIVITSSHPAYILKKDEDYWFIRKEEATLSLLKSIKNSLGG